MIDRGGGAEGRGLHRKGKGCARPGQGKKKETTLNYQGGNNCDRNASLIRKEEEIGMASESSNVDRYGKTKTKCSRSASQRKSGHK